MAQFDILSLQFTESGELQVTVDNPDGLLLYHDPQHSVPEEVEQVPPGGTSTQTYWVHEENYHLTITLKGSGGDNPLVVSDTGYFNYGEEPEKFLDTVITEMETERNRPRKVRRKAIKVK